MYRNYFDFTENDCYNGIHVAQDVTQVAGGDSGTQALKGVLDASSDTGLLCDICCMTQGTEKKGLDESCKGIAFECMSHSAKGVLDAAADTGLFVT